MDGDNRPSAVYRQIKENSEELLDYLRELKEWETEIRQKDKALIEEKLKRNRESEPDLLPPIRNTTGNVSKTQKTEPLTKKKTSKPTKEDKKTRISSYDYASWDKFDVDEAFKEMDESDDNNNESDSESESLLLKQEAEVEKEKGNEHLKANRLDDAIECYTKGFLIDQNNPLIPANRALAFLKKEQYGSALEDCNVALRLDPSYTKGYLRRAAAKMGLRKYNEAKEDLLKVLKLEPNNMQARQELEKIDKVSSTAVVKTSDAETNSGSIDSLVVTPIEKPPHLRSKKPLHRIKIVEVLEEDKQPLSSVNQEMSKDERKTVVKTVQSRDVVPSNTVPSRMTSIPCVPTVNVLKLTSYEFHKDFRRLKCYPESLYNYIKQIPASKYPQLFQHSLESDVMSQLLLVYRDFYLPNELDVYPVLLHLSKIKRFSTLRMFFSDEDKKVLRDLFMNLKKRDNSSEGVETLINSYEMQI